MGLRKKIPNIPRKEEEIEEFCQTFLKCLNDSKHSRNKEIRADIDTLCHLLDSYQKLKTEQDRAQEKYQKITSDKDTMLLALTKLLRKSRRDIQKLDDDTSGSIAVRMQFRDRYQILPGKPRNLEGKILDRGAVLLSWEKPKRGDGGIINHYEILMSRSQENLSSEQEFEIVGTSDSSATEQEFRNLPKGEKLVFKVISINHLGNSEDSSNKLELIL